MNPIVAFLLQAEAEASFSWNYVVLGVLVVLAVVLGMSVMKKRQKDF